MSKVAKILKKSTKALRDLDLLKILQSEIKYELSNDFYKNKRGSLEDFKINYDLPHSKDLILRKKCGSGEELAISALLGEQTFLGGDCYPKDIVMKICIKKNESSSILQFDCKVLDEGQNKVDFHIQNAYLLKSTTDLSSSVYRGPLFRSLDPDLQDELKQYLISRGIGKNVTNFILVHVHNKEQNQYINWLQKLEAMLLKK